MNLASPVDFASPCADAVFRVGDCVRVRLGVADPDFPDLLLEGWTGTVCAIARGASFAYVVEWSRRTLENIDPAVRRLWRWEGVSLRRTPLPGQALELHAE